MLKENEIPLRFPKTLSRISGNDYGFSVYEKQIKDKIDESKLNVIIFPETIQGISISFVQGLMSEEIKKLGREKIFSTFKFKSVYSELEKSIEESIRF